MTRRGLFGAIAAWIAAPFLARLPGIETYAAWRPPQLLPHPEMANMWLLMDPKIPLADHWWATSQGRYQASVRPDGTVDVVLAPLT